MEQRVHFKFLARQFAIAGGDIRKTSENREFTSSFSRGSLRSLGATFAKLALDAAFMAAQDGKLLTMNQLITAMSSQLPKQGRLATAAELKQYDALRDEG